MHFQREVKIFKVGFMKSWLDSVGFSFFFFSIYSGGVFLKD